MKVYFSQKVYCGFYLILLLPSSRCVDLRTVSYEVPPQEMLSRDSVTVSVDAVCFYKISNPLAAVCNVGNYTHSTNLLVATSLRNVLGTKVRPVEKKIQTNYVLLCLTSRVPLSEFSFFGAIGF